MSCHRESGPRHRRRASGATIFGNVARKAPLRIGRSVPRALRNRYVSLYAARHGDARTGKHDGRGLSQRADDERRSGRQAGIGWPIGAYGQVGARPRLYEHHLYHGMGIPRRYETVSRVLDAMDRYASAEPIGQIGILRGMQLTTVFAVRGPENFESVVRQCLQYPTMLLNIIHNLCVRPFLTMLVCARLFARIRAQ